MHDVLADSTILELVERVYAAGCDPAEWQSFVDDLYARLEGVGFSTHIMVDSDLKMHGAGIPDEHIASYRAHYHALNPYTSVFEKLKPGRVYTTTEFGTRQWITGHEFYHEWLKPAGDLLYGAAIIVARDHRSSMRVSCDVPKPYGHLEDVCAKLLTRLGPHLSRAFAVNERLQAAAATEATLESLIDRIDGAALILGADARVLALNRQAEALAQHGRLLRIVPPGRVTFRHPDYDAAFRRALAVALGSLGDDAPFAFPVDPGQDDGFGGEPVATKVLLLPLRPRPDGVARAMAGPRALMVIVRAQAMMPPGELLKSVYRLTKAESELVLEIAAGACPAEAAEKLGVTRTTARNQLSTAMGKMGVHRQAELVAAIATLVPRLRLESD